jgi:hypothetical protein
MFEEIPVFDEGKESIQPVSEAKEETPVVEASAPNLDSTDETKEDESTPKEDKSSEGEEVSAEAEEEKEADESDVSDEARQKFQDDAEKRIADGTAPKWFKNYVENVYKPNLEKARKDVEVYEPLKDFGELPKVLEELEILKGLESFETDPATNLPKPTVKPFVTQFVEKKGIDTVMKVMEEFGNLESPLNKGNTLFHEIIRGAGLDPTRLEDYKRFQENGYRLANDGLVPPDPEQLELIPAELREAFTSLTPDEREEMLLLNDAVRDRALTGIQNTLDSERKEKEAEKSQALKEVEQQQKAKQEFYQAVGTKEAEYIDASGTKLFDSFAESLVSTGLDEIESLGLANLMSMTLNSTGVEAKRNIALLEKHGITIDASLMETFSKWMEAARNMATFEVQKDERSYKTAKEDFESLEEKLIRKSNPIVAAIAKARTTAQKTQSDKKSEVLAEVTKQKVNANTGDAHKITGGGNAQGSWEDIPVFAT